jgi:hypothetical protein
MLYKDSSGVVSLPIEVAGTRKFGFILYVDAFPDLGQRDKPSLIRGLKALASKKGWLLEIP